MSDTEVRIVRNERGQFTLYVNGKFEGNYDTVNEALAEYRDSGKEKKE